MLKLLITVVETLMLFYVCLASTLACNINICWYVCHSIFQSHIIIAGGKAVKVTIFVGQGGMVGVMWRQFVSLNFLKVFFTWYERKIQSEEIPLILNCAWIEFHDFIFFLFFFVVPLLFLLDWISNQKYIIVLQSIDVF